MSYQNYEEYMRNVLGYSPYVQNNYTYSEPEDMYNYEEMTEEITNIQDVTPFYPEIYKIVYPMVCKVCNINLNRELTKELLEQMTDEIYNNVEPQETTEQRVPLKNGDVRNPNSKDPEPVLKETRQTNFLLRDLIRILLLREWGRPTRPPFRPPMGPGGRPPMPPPRPGNNRPPMAPPPRPRYY
ncbi:MAG: hypothetical protein J5507_02825 [Clostridia bacterium]|nr:hypothetical protein [Clostridia bacterium]